MESYKKLDNKIFMPSENRLDIKMVVILL